MSRRHPAAPDKVLSPHRCTLYVPPLSSLPGNNTPEVRKPVQDQTYSAMSQAKVLDEKGNGSPIRVGDDGSTREEESQASFRPDSDSGVAGLMRGWWKSMIFADT